MADKDKKKSLDALSEAPKPKPTMYLDGEGCIDGAEVGGTATLSVTAKCVSVSEENDDEGGSRRSQRWEIQGIKRAGDAAADDAKAAFAKKVQKKGW